MQSKKHVFKKQDASTSFHHVLHLCPPFSGYIVSCACGDYGGTLRDAVQETCAQKARHVDKLPPLVTLVAPWSHYKPTPESKQQCLLNFVWNVVWEAERSVIFQSVRERLDSGYIVG